MRFCFDIDDGSGLKRDEDGDELHDFDAARDNALRCLPDIMDRIVPQNDDRREYTIDVRDDTGRRVYTAALSVVARRLT